MSVTVELLRTQIGDRPVLFPPPTAEPEILGIGDGTATIFTLSYENYIPGTLTIYEAPAPSPGNSPIFTAVNSSNYVVGGSSPGPDGTGATNATITFNSAPAAGTLIGARYQATAFSDADLTAYLENVQALSYPDDRTTLKAAQFDIIPAILGDQRRMDIISQGDYRHDPSSYRAGLVALRESLRKDLTGAPLPGTDVPAISIAGGVINRYGPVR